MLNILGGLAGGKFDALAYDEATMSDYLKTHPGAFTKLFPDYPLAIYPTVMLLPAGDTKFKSMIDNTLREIQYDGTLGIIIKNNNASDILKVPAKPFQE